MWRLVCGFVCVRDQLHAFGPKTSDQRLQEVENENISRWERGTGEVVKGSMQGFVISISDIHLAVRQLLRKPILPPWIQGTLAVRRNRNVELAMNGEEGPDPCCSPGGW